MSNPFGVFLTSVVSLRKPDGRIFAEKLKASVEANRIEIHDTNLLISQGDVAVRHLPNGTEELYEVHRVDFKDGIAGHIPGWIELHCVRRKQPMPQFGSQYPVTIVRARGTAEEKTWEAQMGGDLDRNALFYVGDRVKTGDEIESDILDEPRVIARVKPSLTFDGVSHWEAEMMPQSEWLRRHWQNSPGITIHGQGARVNIASTDHSIQQFHNSTGDNAPLFDALAELKAAIEQNVSSPAERGDASLDVEQLKIELQRSKPDKSLISTLVQRIGSLAGLTEAIAKLIPALQTLGLFHKG